MCVASLSRFADPERPIEPGLEAGCVERDARERAMHGSDEELMAHVVQRDEAAFGELYDRFSPRIFGLLLKLLRERAAAEDVLQETFVQVWNQADKFNADLGSVGVWISTIARRRGVDLLRKRRTVSLEWESASEVEHGWEISVMSSSVGVERDENWAIASKALAALNTDVRACVVLAYAHGKTHEEIASIKNMPVGTVKTWIRRGVESVRDALKVHRELSKKARVNP
jgi:RNA polymerase sigma-70 factor, ECF subfamily